jgi:protein-disulfide isomerase
MKRKTLFTVAMVGFFIAFIVATLIYNVERDDQATQLATANQAALLRMHSPSLGPQDAPVVIVEFIDPACETCAAFYPMVKQLLAANPQKIRLVLRYAPFHKGSDQVVAALEAARKQGKFWPALEALLAAQSDWTRHHVVQVERIWPHLERAGINLQQLRADMAAPEITGVIEQDLLDAQTLKVSKTPDFFVNGRALPSFGIQQLKTLVDEELGRR